MHSYEPTLGSQLELGIWASGILDGNYILAQRRRMPLHAVQLQHRALGHVSSSRLAGVPRL